MRAPFDLMEGTPGIQEYEIAHLMIPGRFRSDDGMGLHPFSEARAAAAGIFDAVNRLTADGGTIVCSGYKTPGDTSAQPWYDALGTEYMGIPEAISMKHLLVGRFAIPSSQVIAETKSIDTITNFTRSQELFRDDRPVGIMAQEQHLDRILKIIAPHTMKRDYVGIVVPELPNMPDTDTFDKRLISRYAVRGLTPETPNSTEIAEQRIMGIWKAIFAAQSLKQSLSLRTTARA